MTPTILEAIRDERLLGKGFKKRWLKGDTWKSWRSFLSAVFGLPFEDDAALATYRACTGRTDPPSEQFREAYLICGRRSGKSYLTAACATFIAAFRDHTPFLSPGEVGVVAIVAADKSQAAIILKYIRGFFQASAVLRSMVVSDLKETIALKNGIEIQILTADFRSVRGRTLCAALVDELAFLNSSDGSANPDTAVLEALRPGLISIPDSILIGLSSPYAKRGELFRQYKENFGVNTSPVLIWKAASSTMNPSLNRLSIAAAFLRDAVSARTEYDAEFRDDVSGFLSQEVLDSVVVRGRTSLPRVAGVSYGAFCDPSGGRGDSMVLAIGHLENEKGVLDVLVERRAPFVPQEAVAEFCAVLKQFGVSEVTGDRYSAEWCASEFQKNGVRYSASERSRSQIYLEFLPSATSGRVELLDSPRMVSQFVGLERKVGRNQDSIDHGTGQHDDLCNAAAGCLVNVLEGAGEFGFLSWFQGFREGTRGLFLPGPRPEVSPRDQNVAKAKAFELERKQLGLDPLKLNPQSAAAFNPPETPECIDANCRKLGKCTTWCAGQVRCGNCARQWWPNGTAPEIIFMGRNGPISRRLN